MNKHAAIQQAHDLCRTHFDNRDRSGYKKIINLLKPFEKEPNIDRVLRLANAGESMVSPRFGYPHIESELRRLGAKA